MEPHRITLSDLSKPAVQDEPEAEDSAATEVSIALATDYLVALGMKLDECEYISQKMQIFHGEIQKVISEVKLLTFHAGQANPPTGELNLPLPSCWLILSKLHQMRSQLYQEMEKEKQISGEQDANESDEETEEDMQEIAMEELRWSQIYSEKFKSYQMTQNAAIV
jgi:hypothetical protein